MKYVKVCGLKNYEDIKICKEGGADAVGFIYKVPKSPRNLDKKMIEYLIQQINNNIFTVAVSKPQNITELMELVEKINVNYYQIHSSFKGSELERIPQDIKAKVILALKLNPYNIKEIIARINKYQQEFFAFLIDDSEGEGHPLNLSLVKKLLDKTDNAKIILAGGISIKNVEDIATKLNTYGIDVSSSLESEQGIKDPSKIIKFLEKIKELRKKLGE